MNWIHRPRFSKEELDSEYDGGFAAGTLATIFVITLIVYALGANLGPCLILLTVLDLLYLLRAANHSVKAQERRENYLHDR